MIHFQNTTEDLPRPGFYVGQRGPELFTPRYSRFARFLKRATRYLIIAVVPLVGWMAWRIFA